MKKPTIGLDLSAGDCGSVLLEVLDSIQHKPYLNAHFFIPDGVSLGNRVLKSNIQVTYCKDQIDPNIDHKIAYRKLRNSPIHTAFNALNTEDIDIIVSNGSTGLLSLLTKKNFHLLPFHKQPALSTVAKINNSPCMLLDIGAMAVASDRNLVEFAKMGLRCLPILGINNPRVGLLNIGTEFYKGRSEHIRAHRALSAMQDDPNLPFQFVGNIESANILENKVNLVICDGFSGNIFIKTVEALAPHCSLNIEILPGAFLLGGKKLIIKCHSSATPQEIITTIEHPIVRKANQLLEIIDQ